MSAYWFRLKSHLQHTNINKFIKYLYTKEDFSAETSFTPVDYILNCGLDNILRLQGFFYFLNLTSIALKNDEICFCVKGILSLFILRKQLSKH